MATNPILDIPIRQRESTNVPLPFEAMYTVLAEKQKRYDAAEAYEREKKSFVTNFNSPISGHNQYLQQLKNNYMENVMNLHKSTPDKGSAEYARKLQDNVDAFMNDPNFNLIKESGESYKKFIEASAQHMANGKYSRKAAEPYLNFQGVNPDGTLQRMVFAGLRPKVDLQETYARAYALTPEEKGFKTFIKGNSVVTLQESGKKPEKLKQTYQSLLGQEGLDDYMDDHNLTTPQDLDAHLTAQTLANSDYKVSTKIDPNYEGAYYDLALQKHNLDILKTQMEMTKLAKEAGEDASATQAVPLSGLNNIQFNPDVANSIDEKTGDIVGLQNSPWYKNIFSTLVPDLEEAIVGPKDPTTTNVQNLFSEQERNARVINSNTNDKINVNDVRKRYKNGAKVDLPLLSFKSTKDADEALNLVIKDLPVYRFYKVDGDKSEDVTDKMADLVPALRDKDSKVTGFALGKLNSFNSFGPHAVVMNMYGDTDVGENPTIIASRGIVKNTLQELLAKQEHELAKAYYDGVPITLPYYIDPTDPTKLKFSSKNAPNGIEVFWRNFDDPQSSRFINVK